MLTAAVAGAVAVLAFAPFGYWPLQILSLGVLFYQVLRAANVKAGALIGWAYGFGWCAAGTHWLYISMHRYGDMAAPIAVIAVALLALLMAIYVAMAMGAAAWLRQRWVLSLPAMTLLVLPATWTLFEWTRGWLFTGFPWLATGYAHNASPLAGFAPIVGAYGLGWLAALSAGALLLLTHRTRWFALGGVIALYAAGIGLQYVAWTHPVGRPITVRLLQGNVPQQQKFDPGFVLGALHMYQSAITSAPADLIATPETAVTVLPHQLPPGYLDSLAAYSQQTGSTILVGMPVLDEQQRFYNAALGITPNGAPGPYYQYRKHHLVPFGEFVPPGLHWFVAMMAIPLGDMGRGAEVQAPLQVRDQLVLPNICYEDLFGEEIAGQLASAHRHGKQSASVLLNISNLAWFGDSIAIPQHLQISQMRSLETGRPMLRSTNTGATAVIDGKGVVQSLLPPEQQATLAAKVQGMGGMTPYILYGNKLVLALAALALLAAFLLSRAARRGRAGQ
ncbi:apolipoprotein N-acyltransferase [Janthinobacterium lividum]|uniref:apolipoprotein N-acyltransferase n=2 Tax=Janthinobacterium TaxID=29580 RepID=UPI001594FE53|nr:apolipoprotein N-acyltransferase [Janthinobacterium lividum]QKY05280.1 apolipoprotein N-acyltransferase [Janthinobacterium lividum]